MVLPTLQIDPAKACSIGCHTPLGWLGVTSISAHAAEDAPGVVAIAPPVGYFLFGVLDDQKVEEIQFLVQFVAKYRPIFAGMLPWSLWQVTDRTKGQSFSDC